MTDVLIVLSPRRITECVEALETLEIDKLWVRNLSERQIVERWVDILDLAAGYDRAFLVSDDVLPRPHHLKLLQGLLDDGHPVVTGFCNLDVGDPRVNLCRTSLGAVSVPDAYDFYTLPEVMVRPSETVPTFFAGFALTGMTVEMWAEYPYRLEGRGWAADFTLSKRLEADGVPVVAHRDAFMWHVKERWCLTDQEPRKRLLVGVEPASVDLEEWVFA